MVQPIRRLVGQLSDKELQDGTQITLSAHRGHLHRSGHGGVTVTAAGKTNKHTGKTMTFKSFLWFLATQQTRNHFYTWNKVGVFVT